MKYILLIFGFCSIITIYFFSNTNTSKKASENNLVGTWELNEKGYGDIVPPVNYCCEYIEFKAQINSKNIPFDYIVEDEVKTSGTFSIDTNENKMILKRKNGTSYSYSYSLTSNVLEVSYLLDNNVRHWIRFKKVY